MIDSLRDCIAKAACGATSAGKLFPWDTLSDAHRESWYAVADAIIRVLNLRIVGDTTLDPIFIAGDYLRGPVG